MKVRVTDDGQVFFSCSHLPYGIICSSCKRITGATFEYLIGKQCALAAESLKRLLDEMDNEKKGGDRNGE